MWRDLPSDIKYLFVIKSRLDEEKARFEAKTKILKNKFEASPSIIDSDSKMHE